MVAALLAPLPHSPQKEWSRAETIRFEAARVLFQLAVIGFFSAVLTQEYSRRRERRDASNEFDGSTYAH
jgi:hypothetical protein